MTNTPVADLAAELEMLAALLVSRRSNDEIDAAMLKAADALIAQQARIEALEEALSGWNTAFGVADAYAVAIHDADGKSFSVRAHDYHVLHDLYRSRAALDATDNT